MTYEEFNKLLWESKSKTGNISQERVIDRLSKFVYDMYIENDVLKNKIEGLEYKIYTMQYVIDTIRSDTSRVKYQVEPDFRYML